MKSFLLVLALLPNFLHAREVVYHLSIAKQQVNITGKAVNAMTINGGIPGPTLRFTEGDTAVIHVHNMMDTATSVHWHGMLVPPDMDGVPFITYPGIEPGETFTYRFPIRQSGTYWYHSHTMLQEQRGVFGSIVILPRKRGGNADMEHVVVLSDWTNKNPMEILRNLRRGSEYFGVEKGTSQSLLGAAKTGKLGAWFGREGMRMPAMDLADVAYDAFLVNGKPEESLAAGPGRTIRLRIIDGSASSFFHLSYAGGPMTIVSADGQAVVPLKMMKPILIGIAETYDVLVKVPASGAYEFRATAHDGSGHSSLWIGSGERHPAKDLPMPFVYDTMMGFNWKNAFALTPAGSMGMPDRDVDAGKFDSPGMHMEGMGHNGPMKMQMAMQGMDHESMPGMDMSGMDMSNMDHSKMDHSKMDHSTMKMDHGMSGMDHSSMSGMQDMGVKHNPPVWYDFLLRDDAARAPLLATDGMMSTERPFAPYKKLRATRDTSYPASAPRREFRLTLDGDMTRYVWMINNKPIQPGDDLHIREGEVVRFIMINRTMMHHPMHLHGHFFRVLNGQGNRSPLKHTVDVEPMSTTVIEFMADEPGDWFFHCHLLYHMMSGMARIVEYEGYTPAPETAAVRDRIYQEANPWLFYGFADILSSETQGRLTLSDPLNIISLEWEAGWHASDGIDWEGDLTYGRYFNRFTTVFAGVYAEGNNSDSDTERAIAGVSFLLPGNFMSRAWIDSDGGARVTLDREIMLTPRLGIFGEVEYDTHDKWSSQAGFSYLINQYFSVTTIWDTDYGLGAGITVRF
ncbi:MAG: multicopper oxidase domain-containing protein [Luteolibacter sp.]|uniref:multicopper oxidase domain-containing protein n=1 Tax=Luteolibacter sp. TaxID=1962973 RepID=UPI0032676F67